MRVFRTLTTRLLQNYWQNLLFLRQLETELNEKLAECHEKLLQAGVDKKESERDARLKETFANLQRIFPGLSLLIKYVKGFRCLCFLRCPG